MHIYILLVLPLWGLLAGPAPTAPPTLTLKDGRVYELKAPPRTENGRVVFTTTDGKTYSLNASEVQSFGPPPAPTRSPSTDPLDSRNLGAIARQERASTGKTTELSTSHPTPRATHPPKRTPTAKRAKSPRPTATPTPAAR